MIGKIFFMLNKSLSLLWLLLITSMVVNAQQKSVNESDQQAVKLVIQNMFAAMKTSDTNLLKTCFSPTSIFQTVVSKEKQVQVKEESLQYFINSIGKQPAGALDERIEFETVKVDKDLAMVWTPYQFFYKDKYSHSGVNSFQLVRFIEGWKIQYLIDTRYR
jgi:hypothetical protein